MPCRPAQRRRANQAATVFEAAPRVIEATVVSPGEDPTDEWLLDVALSSRVDGFPTDLCDDLAFSLDVRHVAPEGDCWLAHLTV
jgi:hypothetical protein